MIFPFFFFRFGCVPWRVFTQHLNKVRKKQKLPRLQRISCGSSVMNYQATLQPKLPVVVSHLKVSSGGMIPYVPIIYLLYLDNFLANQTLQMENVSSIDPMFSANQINSQIIQEAPPIIINAPFFHLTTPIDFLGFISSKDGKVCKVQTTNRPGWMLWWLPPNKQFHKPCGVIQRLEAAARKCTAWFISKPSIFQGRVLLVFQGRHMSPEF